MSLPTLQLPNIHQTLLFFSLSTIFLLFIICTKRVLLFSKKLTKYPPSPLKLPIIGNLHQIAGLLPHRSLRALSDKHGPLMLLHLGQVPLLVASSPDMAREVMKTQDHLFSSRPSLKAGMTILYDGKDVAFSPYGEYWKQVRKFSVHNLLSPKMVYSYKSIREEEVGFTLEKIRSRCAHGAVNVSEELKYLARDIISRILLGKCLREYEWGDKIQRVISESSGLLGAFLVGDYLRGFGWMDSVTGVDGRIQKSFKEADEILDRIVEDEMMSAWREGDHDEFEGDSFIRILISLEKDKTRKFPFGKDNIKAIIKDMLGAGTESTYTVMGWVMAELMKNPNTLKKLRNEIREMTTATAETTTTKGMIKEQELGKMWYLKAVIKEALRLHPPGPLLVPRELMETTQIGSYEIPQHTRVVTNVWAISRDPKVWEAPDEFRPERFLGSCVDFKGHDFELTPFGAGRRICPGIQFSILIIELTIANLVHLFDWALPGSMAVEDLDMIEAPGITAPKRVDLVLDATPCFS
ncbi:hypothetical protein J5N97_023828 [Dioscorea zingiberensis]|uniref:Cytochrome P450 n=1 Tax=Dioscorea zingiberensis TaxID=325984 RepID=A0A9D5C5A8_9LILI|nr:hypothetical protein J5N97_023828 [Dioscorea zingiberensis]